MTVRPAEVIPPLAATKITLQLVLLGNDRANGHAKEDQTGVVQLGHEQEGNGRNEPDNDPAAALQAEEALEQTSEQFPYAGKGGGIDDLPVVSRGRGNEQNEAYAQNEYHDRNHLHKGGGQYLGQVEGGALDGQGKGQIPLVGEKVGVGAPVHDDDTDHQRGHHGQETESRAEDAEDGDDLYDRIRVRV